MKKFFMAALALGVTFALTGCKGTNEKRGDEHLQEGPATSSTAISKRPA